MRSPHDNFIVSYFSRFYHWRLSGHKNKHICRNVECEWLYSGKMLRLETHTKKSSNKQHRRKLKNTKKIELYEYFIRLYGIIAFGRHRLSEMYKSRVPSLLPALYFSVAFIFVSIDPHIRAMIAMILHLQ